MNRAFKLSRSNFDITLESKIFFSEVA